MSVKRSTSGGASQGAIVRLPESSLSLDGRSSSSGRTRPLLQAAGSRGIELEAIWEGMTWLSKALSMGMTVENVKPVGQDGEWG